MKPITDVPSMHKKFEIQGICHEAFTPVLDALAYNIGSGLDLSASVCILIDGKPVVDLWSGFFDASFLAEEITFPPGVGEDYYIGTPASADPRVALLIPGAPSDGATGNRFYDLALGAPVRWGLGYSLEVSLMPGVPAGARAAWWAGNGASMSYVDLDARMSLAYCPNRWISGQHEMDRARLVIRAAYESVAAATGKGDLRVSRVA